MSDRERIAYDVFSLHSIRGPEYEVLRNRVQTRLAEFPCSRSPHLERFARTQIDKYERHGNSRTYVLITATPDADIDVAAFFTVGMSTIDLSKASESQRKRFSGEFSSSQTSGAYSIAELARSDRYTSAQLPGSVIVDEVKKVIAQARVHVAGRFAVVDSQPAIFHALYEQAGFRIIHGASAPRGMDDREFVTSCCLVRDW